MKKGFIQHFFPQITLEKCGSISRQRTSLAVKRAKESICIMELHELLSYIEQYGYWALFFCLWLGIIGMPIPDEMIVMSGGFVSSLGILSIIPAFLLTYLGVVSGLSLGYILGKIFGTKVLHKLMKKKRQNIF